ncbi:hypothetical protein DLAC_02155 [Tieghemostelium lacteum]|uniref:Uncharacterized protein n=1 Tax=Tieghemostelium lacteum TaxID=361077 RepID=A0A152A4S3_TIELA|nr:hypothetical protein DLAC_02155 [Tieghemostelium lacteum]|eukprot:KYR01061.1 hypothetical protein DLAC_02155 [Tieghemostelium lacteum]
MVFYLLVNSQNIGKINANELANINANANTNTNINANVYNNPYAIDLNAQGNFAINPQFAMQNYNGNPYY